MGFKEYLLYYTIRVIFVVALVVLLLKLIVPRTSLYFRVDLLYPKFGMTLNKTDIVLIRGESTNISVLSPNTRVLYRTTDYKVADVTILGRVIAKKPGLAFIKVKVKGKVLKCRVRVISLNETKLNLSVGKHKWLNVKGALFESYKSSQVSVAKVSAFGKVTAVSKGVSTITVKARGRTLTCKVIVN